MTCLFHCFQLQMICSNSVTDVDRCRCRRPNLAYIIWFSFGLRLCGCTSHCQAEGGKCMGPDRWKFAFPGPGLGQLSMQASEIIRDSIRTRSVPRFRDFTGSRGPELGFRSQLPLHVWSYAMSRLGIPYHLCSVVRSCYDSTCGEAKRFDWTAVEFGGAASRGPSVENAQVWRWCGSHSGGVETCSSRILGLMLGIAGEGCWKYF